MNSELIYNFDLVFNLYGLYNKRKAVAPRADSHYALYQKKVFAEIFITRCAIKAFYN